MVTSLNSKNCELPAYTFKTSAVLLQPIVVEQNGVLVNGNEFKPYDFAVGSTEMKSSLYSISNLQHTGAYDTLKSTFMTTISDFGLVDRFEDLRYVQNVEK